MRPYTLCLTDKTDEIFVWACSLTERALRLRVDTINMLPPRACMGLLLNGAGIETPITMSIGSPISLFFCMGLLLNGAGIETAP